MDAKFSIETHQYRSGAKPLEIVALKTCTTRWKVVSVDPMGCTQLHGEDGSFIGTEGIESEHDLIAIPPKPEVVYWGKVEDVDPAVEWVSIQGIPGPRRLCGIEPDGIWLDLLAGFYSWEKLSRHGGKWSSTRLGEYRPCTTTSEGV